MTYSTVSEQYRLGFKDGYCGKPYRTTAIETPTVNWAYIEGHRAGVHSAKYSEQAKEDERT